MTLYFYFASDGEERRPMKIEAGDWAEAADKAAAIIHRETAEVPAEFREDIRNSIKLKSIEYCDEDSGQFRKTDVSYF